MTLSLDAVVVTEPMKRDHRGRPFWWGSVDPNTQPGYWRANERWAGEKEAAD
jgi:hypothetical protein